MTTRTPSQDLAEQPANDRVLQLQRYWPYQLMVLADRISRHTAALARDHGDLNLSQWRVMAAIAEEPGRTAVDVVTITPMDKGIVSRATKALLEAGLLIRKASQDDGRVSHLYLTEKGEALYQNLRPRIEAVPAAAGRALGVEEQAQLRDMLDRLIAGVPDER